MSGITKELAQAGGLRATVLSSSALALALAWAIGTPALANTLTVGGISQTVTGPVIKISTAGTVSITVDSNNVSGPGSIGLQPVLTPNGERQNFAAIEVQNVGPTSIQINSGLTVGAANTARAIWLNPVTGTGPQSGAPVGATLGIVNNGDILGYGNGVIVEPWAGLCPARFLLTPCQTFATIGSFSMSGTGRVIAGPPPANSSTLPVAIQATANSITIDGLGLIQSARDGLILAGSTVNIGQTTRLGTVVAQNGTGMSVWGDTVNLRVGQISAAGTGSNAISLTGDGIPTGAATVAFNAALQAGGDGVSSRRTSGLVTVTGENVGTITAGGFGVISTASSGVFTNSLAVRNIASIQAGQSGVFLASVTGTLQADSIASITAVNQGFWASTIGNVLIGQSQRIGSVNSGAIGVLLQQPFRQTAPSAVMDVRLTNLTSGIGLFGNGLAATTRFDVTGQLTTSGQALYLFDHLGSVLVDGRSTGRMTSTGGLVVIGRNEGNPNTVTIQNIASLVSRSGPAIFSYNNRDTLVTGVGSAGGLPGFFVTPVAISVDGPAARTVQLHGIAAVHGGIDLKVSDDVVIGTLTPLGPVNGRSDFAIRVGGNGGAGTSARTFSMVSNSLIEGGNSGVTARADAISVLIAGGTVSSFHSFYTGPIGAIVAEVRPAIDLRARSALGLTIAAGAAVVGGTAVNLVLDPAAGNGTAQIFNSGTIRTISQIGSGLDVALGLQGQIAVWNAGEIIGRILHNATPGTGASVGIYNLAGGNWAPTYGLQLFSGIADVLGNEGTITLPGGAVTNFVGLEGFYNNRGGIIDVRGSQPSNPGYLTTDGPLFLQDGGRVRATLYIDQGRTGSSGLIQGAFVTPTGVTQVELGIDAQWPFPLVGSIPLVKATVISLLPAPQPGATLVPAANYAFAGGAPTVPGRTIRLVSDGYGGVYVQWVPTISAGSIGGFSGGALGAVSVSGETNGGGGLSFLQASLSGATRAAGHVADLTSIGAAFGGPVAAGAGCGTGTGASFSVRTGEWAGTGSRAAAGATAHGRDLAFSPGAGSDSCGRVSVGLFQFGGTTTNALTDTGTSGQQIGDSARGTSTGVGGYVRADSGTGFYGQVTGAAGSQRARVRNGIFGTTATVDNRLGLVDVTAGFATPVSDGIAVDARLSATRLVSLADPFKDSQGLEVTSLNTTADSLTATVGLAGRIDSGTGFIRAGIRTTDARLDGVAYGRRTLSEANGTGTVVEAGWTQALGEEASLELALSSETGGLVEQQELRLGYAVSW